MASKSSKFSHYYSFGPFQLDPSKGTLRRDGELILLPPKVFDTLAFLVERHGEVVSKSEMMDAIWQGTFVEEGNLTQNVYVLRRTLGRAPDGREWIETVPRKGYLFVGDVETVSDGESKAVGEPPSRSAYSMPSRSIAVFAAVAVAILILGAAYLYTFRSSDGSGPARSTRDLSLRKLTVSGDIGFPVISPDGASISYSRDGHLFVQSVDNDDAHEISLPPQMIAGQLQFSRDSRSIAFRDQRRFFLPGNVYSVPLTGGTPQLLAKDVWGGFDFSPDGSMLSFVRHLPQENKYDLVIVQLSSGVERVVTEL